MLGEESIIIIKEQAGRRHRYAAWRIGVAGVVGAAEVVEATVVGAAVRGLTLPPRNKWIIQTRIKA